MLPHRGVLNLFGGDDDEEEEDFLTAKSDFLIEIGTKVGFSSARPSSSSQSSTSPGLSFLCLASLWINESSRSTFACCLSIRRCDDEVDPSSVRPLSCITTLCFPWWTEPSGEFSNASEYNVEEDDLDCVTSQFKWHEVWTAKSVWHFRDVFWQSVGICNAPMESICIDPILGVACIEEKMAECFRREIGILFTFIVLTWFSKVSLLLLFGIVNASNDVFVGRGSKTFAGLEESGRP